MTKVEAAAEWRQRLLERAEESRRRRATRASARRLASARRAHGLVDRHVARLTRLRRDPSEADWVPDLDCTE